MDEADLLEVFDRQMRREAAPDEPGARVERVGGVVRQVDAHGMVRCVVWSELDEATADAAIGKQVAYAEQVAYLTGIPAEFEWKLYSHDRPEDLGARLTAAGLAAEPAETLMVGEIAGLALEAPVPEGVRLTPVADAAAIELVAEVHERAFGGGGDRIRRRLLARLEEDPGTVLAAVALAGDRPVCAARMELHRGTDFASLWGGGTVPEWRGRGIYRALVAYRAAIAADHGYRYLQVDASDQSRPILERLGFAVLGTTTPYVYPAPVRP